MHRKLLPTIATAIQYAVAQLSRMLTTPSAAPARCHAMSVEPLESRQLFSAGYSVFELTLGGTTSQAIAVNASGQVAGYGSLVGDSEYHAFFFDGSAIYDLGTLGGTMSSPTALNDSGQVIGDSTLAGDEASHAFLWSGGSMLDLSLGGSFSTAKFINSTGQVVGSSSTVGDTAFLAFLYNGSSMIELGLGGSFSTAIELTRSGLVIGSSSTMGDGFTRAFLYDGHSVIELIGSGNSEALDVNERGQVVGHYTVGGDTHAFVYSGGTFADLGTLGGAYSKAIRINEAGDILGESTTASGELHAFLYRNGVMIDLGAYNANEVVAMNEAGQVLLHQQQPTGHTHAMLYSGSALVDLGTLGGGDSKATGLTESGWVFGNSFNASFINRPFVYINGQMIDIGDGITTDASLIAFNQAGEALIQAGDYYLWSDDGLKRLVDAAPGIQTVTVADTLGESGHVLGQGVVDGSHQVFVLSPQPEPVNTPPAASHDAVETNAGIAVVVDVLVNDTDADGDPLAILEVGPAAHGVVTMTADGKLQYQPAAGYAGTDSFTYTISDGRGGTATGTVTVTVKAAPPPPSPVEQLTAYINSLVDRGLLSRKVADQLLRLIGVLTGYVETAKPSVDAVMKQVQLVGNQVSALPSAERDELVTAVNQVVGNSAAKSPGAQKHDLRQTLKAAIRKLHTH